MSYTAYEKRYEAMKYNRCGKSGLLIPAVSLGLWHNFGTYDSFQNMKDLCFTAFDCGITHFDIANNYGPQPGSAEENFGKILNGELAPYRDQLIISTKAGYYMWEGPYGDWGSRKYLLASLDASLKRLKTDYVDIFYHHRMDPNTPLEETMGALASAVKSGKALYAGLSNYDGETMKKAAAILRELNCPFVLNQNRYSILDRAIENNGLKAAAESEGKGIIVFSPLAQGLLTDRYIESIPEDSRAKRSGRFLNEQKVLENIEKIRRLKKISDARGETLAQMALAWVLRDKACTGVLIGASKPQQIKENVKVVKAADFTDEEIRLIDEAVK